MTSTDFQEELCARSRCDLSDLRHLGYTVPPQPDAGWIGEAGPGPSYVDESSGALSTTSRTGPRRS